MWSKSNGFIFIIKNILSIIIVFWSLILWSFILYFILRYNHININNLKKILQANQLLWNFFIVPWRRSSVAIVRSAGVLEPVSQPTPLVRMLPWPFCPLLLLGPKTATAAKWTKGLWSCPTLVGLGGRSLIVSNRKFGLPFWELICQINADKMLATGQEQSQEC